MSPNDPSTYQAASLSDVGQVRAQNEDFCSEFQREGGYRLMVVADGMGGHRGGATASRLAVEAIGEGFSQSPNEPKTLLFEAFTSANDRVYRTALESPDLRGMGTTAVALLFGPDLQGWVAHVGDSRAYRLRDGVIQPITEDHSVVAEMVRRGLISPDEAAIHPRRNEILRSIGVEPNVKPDIAQLDILPGDRYLLCSDGLSGMLSDEEIAAIAIAEPPSTATRSLVESANRRGGPDNITVQIVAVPGDGSAATDRFAGDRSRRVRMIAAATAIIAGLLALALVALL